MEEPALELQGNGARFHPCGGLANLLSKRLATHQAGKGRALVKQDISQELNAAPKGLERR